MEYKQLTSSGPSVARPSWQSSAQRLTSALARLQALPKVSSQLVSDLAPSTLQRSSSEVVSDVASYPLPPFRTHI